MARLGNFFSKTPQILCFLLSILCLFNFNQAFAEVRVKARLITPNVSIGEQVRIQIELSSSENNDFGGDVRPVEIIGDGALEFLGINQSSSSSYSIMNGKTKSSFTKTLTLNYAAFKEGVWTVPKINIGSSGGKTAGPFKVRVFKVLPDKYKKNRAQAKKPKQYGGLLDKIFGGGQNSAYDNSPNRKIEFFAEAEVDKTKVYAGEQIYVSFNIYTSGSITQFDTLKFPTFKGFWKEDVNFAGRFMWEPVIKNGRRMQKAELSSYILIPYKAGNLEVDSFKLRAGVSQRSFGFGRENKVIKFDTKSIPIEVLPFTEPEPESFKGGVGRFAAGVVGGLNRRQINAGEVYELRLKVVGDQSSVKFVEAPALDLGDDFKLLSQDEEYRFFKRNLSSMKIFKYNIIPKKEGIFKIPDAVLDFHAAYGEKNGPDSFYQLVQELPTLKVIKGRGKVKAKDELFISEDKTAKWRSFKEQRFLEFISSKISWWLYLIFMLALFVASYFVFKREIKVGEFDDLLRDKLENYTQKAKESFKDRNFKNSATELINYYYLIVGALIGKRLSTEEEFMVSIESIPAGLKKHKESIKEQMNELQELRFGSDLSIKKNQDRLDRCIQKQEKDLKLLESYIS